MMTGPTELRDWIRSKHYTIRAAAVVLQIPEASLRAYLGGARVPGVERAERLRRRCGIKAAAWVEE
jgi:plasmid maintenance system antidote protein VapI